MSDTQVQRENDQQTSVFINETSRNGASDPTSDTLISPNSGSRASTRKTSRALAARGSKGWIFFFIFLLLSAGLLILLIFLLRGRGKSETIKSRGLMMFCNQSEPLPLESSFDLHHRCSKIVNVTKGCFDDEWNSWLLLEPRSEDWSKIMNLLDFPNNGTEHLIVSKTFNVTDPQACALHISFHFAESYHLYYVTQDNATLLRAENTSYGCDDVTLRQSTIGRPFFLAVVSTSRELADTSRLEMTSQACLEYTDIQTKKLVSLSNLPAVNESERNFCSFGFFQKKYVCDWMDVRGPDNADFKQRLDHRCVATGVSLLHGGYFVSFSPTKNDSRAILVSPVVTGRGRRLMFSFWHLAFCDGFRIQVYVVPFVPEDPGSAVDKVGVENLIYEMRNKTPDNRWSHARILLNTTNLEKFQFLIKASGTVSGSCQNYHECTKETEGGPKSPILALDDLLIEAIEKQCNISNGSNASTTTALDCLFQNSTGAKTYCHWEAGEDSGGTPDYQGIPDFPGIFEFGWSVLDHIYEDDFPDQGPGAEHFKDRGFILLLDGSGVDEKSVFSAFLQANSVCSCRMTFLYLLRGSASPRLELSMRVGPKTDPDNRPSKVLWSLHGHQGHSWKRAEIILNLNTGPAFQLQFKGYEFPDSRGEIALDDIKFHNCDLQFAESAKQR